MSIDLALADAANNCVQHGAVAEITLKSGALLVGHLERQSGADLGTRHMKTPGGGWVTFRVDEIAAVGVEPNR